MIKSYVSELKQVLDTLDETKINSLVQKILTARDRGNTVFIVGNGGSAVNASHWACDLSKGTLNRFYHPTHKRLRVVSLTDNVATITALANDLTYDEIFSQQLRNLIVKDDVLVVITGSGKSRNIINSIEAGKRAGAYVFALAGFDGGEVSHIADECLIIPSKNYGVIEDAHLTIGHIITNMVKQETNVPTSPFESPSKPGS